MRYDALNNFPNLGVFPKRMSAFCTPHELSGGFVAAPSLHLPNINQVIFTFFAFHFNGLHRRNLLILFAYNRHERFRFGLDNCTGACLCFSVCWLLCKIAFCATKHKGVADAGFLGFKT
jgi:hypothetical protein